MKPFTKKSNDPNPILMPLSILLITFAVLSLTYLNRPLNLDETGTYHTIHNGVLSAIDLSINNPQQSPPYYVALALWCKAFGTSEVALRIPSLIFGFLAILMLYFVITHVFDSKTALLTGILLSASENYICNIAFVARPYSLAFLCCTTSLLLSSAWITTRYWRYYILSLFLAVVAIYIHLMATMFLGLQLLFLLIYRKPKKDILSIAAFVIAPTIFATLPILSDGRMVREVDSSVLIEGSSQWSIWEYAFYFKSLLRELCLATFCLLATMLPKILWKEERTLTFNCTWQNILLTTGWFLSPIISFFSLQILLKTFLMFIRYISWALPAAALIISGYFQLVARNQRHLNQSVTLYLSLNFIFVVFVIYHENRDFSNFKSLSANINLLIEGGRKPVVLQVSNYVEGRSVKQLNRYKESGNFNSHFLYYPVNAPTYTLPLHRHQLENLNYEDQVLREVLPEANTIILASMMKENYKLAPIILKIKKAGFKQVKLFREKNLELVKFKRV